MSVSFPNVDTGQVGYNVCPQFLVCGELKHNRSNMFETAADNRSRAKERRGDDIGESI